MSACTSNLKSRRGKAIYGDISDDDAAAATAMSGRTRNIHGRENRGGSNKTNGSRSYSKARGGVPSGNNNDDASAASAAAAANDPVKVITPQERICREREARERAREERMKEQEQRVLEREQKRNGRSQLTITPQDRTLGGSEEQMVPLLQEQQQDTPRLTVNLFGNPRHRT